jgi:cap1 methyltransferase
MYESFEHVFIYKPDTSRPANSEKYIICINYKDNLTNTEKDNMIMLIEKWNNFSIEEDKNPKKINSFIFKNIKIDNNFINKLQEYNKLYMNNQMIYLNKTIELAQNKFDKDKYYNIIQNQVSNALDWCKKYKIDINKNSIYYKKNII